MKIIHSSIVAVHWVAIILLSGACSRPPDPGPLVFDVYLDIRLRNKDGADLLNVNTLGAYKKEGIRVFYLDNGVKKEFFTITLDAQRNFLIQKNEGTGEYYMRLFPFSGLMKDHEITTTFINWDGNDEDTVSCTMLREFTLLSIRQARYNGILKYDVNSSHDITWGTMIFPRLLDIEK